EIELVRGLTPFGSPAFVEISIAEQFRQYATVHLRHFDIEQFGDGRCDVEVRDPLHLLTAPNAVAPSEKDAVEFRVGVRVAVRAEVAGRGLDLLLAIDGGLEGVAVFGE